MTCSCVWHPGCRASGGRARLHSLAGVACTPSPSALGPQAPRQRPWTIRATGQGLVYATALPTIVQFLPHTPARCPAGGLGCQARARPCRSGRHPPGPAGRTPHPAPRPHAPRARHAHGTPTTALCCRQAVAPTRCAPAAGPSLAPPPSAARARHRSRVSRCSRLLRRHGPGEGREACVLAYLLETHPRTYWRRTLVPIGDAPSYLLETKYDRTPCSCMAYQP